MPKLAPMPTTSCRRSTRVKKPVQKYFFDDDSGDEKKINKETDFKLSREKDDTDDEEEEMPSDYDPSDDSDIDDDEELAAAALKRKAKGHSEDKAKQMRLSIGTRSDKLDLSKMEKDVLPSTLNYQSTSNGLNSESGDNEELVKCIICEEMIEKSTNARFHYSSHYYDEGAFFDTVMPSDLLNGKAQDEVGRIHKYQCPHNGCTKRMMGYKELCVHLGTAHQQLKDFLKDDIREGMLDVMNELYPPSNEPFSPGAIKKEKDVIQSKAVVTEIDKSEVVDDPDESTTVRQNSPVKVASYTTSITIQKPGDSKVNVLTGVRGGRYAPVPSVDKAHCCLVCNGKGEIGSEGRNLNLGSGLYDTKYHYTMCVYSKGWLMKLIDPGQGDGIELKDLDEYGNSYKYKCPFIGCYKSMPRCKSMGYKEYAIHVAVQHNIIEKWMLEDGRQGLSQVIGALRESREQEGWELEDLPALQVESIHTCLVCKGDDKDAKNLGFEGTKLFSTRYHYASCLFEENIVPFTDMYPPGEKNLTKNGKVKDLLGREVKYTCHERGCKTKRKMGYTEFATHAANEHGGLEKIMLKDTRSEIRELVSKIRKK